MTTLDNYPMGAANDPRAPYNEPLPTKVKVEVGVELGLFVDVEVIDEDDIKVQLKKLFIIGSNSKDVEINNIEIYQHDLFSKSEQNFICVYKIQRSKFRGGNENIVASFFSSI